VTGGGQGIGLACVDALPEAGTHVYIAAYDDKVAAEGRAAMNATGYATDVIQMDVTKPLPSTG
jgi:NAD(P)-dependent dehydrogenase (short-subunit alcohol dehydrogenase family)